MTISVRWTKLLPRAAAAVAVAVSFLKWSELEPQQIYSAAGVIAGVSATLLGFLITAVALITALMDRTLIINMRKTGHYRVLVGDAFLTCGLLLATLAVSTASLVLTEAPLRLVFSATLFGLALSLLFVFESGRRFSLVIKAL